VIAPKRQPRSHSADRGASTERSILFVVRCNDVRLAYVNGVSQLPPNSISNAHPVGSRCGDQDWSNLPSTRYVTGCTVPAFCAMVLASDLQSTDRDTSSSRLPQGLLEPCPCALLQEAPRPTTGSLRH
ncbi:hypothetical protein CORC01_03391, partial [Colletotrichum orchidophilum]